MHKGHTIIAETEVPNLDYSGVNIVRFTHKQGEGRYGLLYDVY
jgi:hypothetical protein